MDEFAEDWNFYHPAAKPVGFMLRNTGTPHWVRFHSLPGSSRYPNSRSEEEILLARQNRLAAEVLGEGNQCWLVQSHFRSTTDTHTEVGASVEIAKDFTLDRSFTFAPPDGDDDGQWIAYSGLVRWMSGAHDELLLAIAEDRAGPTLWMARTTGMVFAPYDGGIDLFLRDEATLKSLSAKYADWLPKNQWGL